MHCVNHPGTDVQSFCQNCGKPLCAQCLRTTASGQIFCENCVATAGSVPGQGQWQGSGSAPPFYVVPQHGPNPSAAAVLGLIPGAGAMYNGQFFKGLIHVVVFAVLISITERYPLFGLFIAAWILYQSFEAFHTAKARRDGHPLPDPFGLNELGNWLNLGTMSRSSGPPPYQATPPPAGGYAQVDPPPYSAPYASTGTAYGTGYPSGAAPGAGTGAGPIPPQPPFSEPYVGPEPFGEGYPPGPIPPVAPYYWRRKEPVFAFVLIGLGVIFLLQSLGFVDHLMHYIWPIMLIGLGIWLIVRRVGWPQGGPK